ncbi:hypothetical protein PGT21_024741 [Puccinia graminis f. sp. tritici]|uniref:RING-type domain-containing protein n=1 Tax=Puccinia graminis f. sp. tritici TaxID=56615 RepID=A0A5B0PIV2_PUCGR|nr:hypothetical protein PGT21_024741 [Puccinia graminis f. sp. tritici]
MRLLFIFLGTLVLVAASIRPVSDEISSAGQKILMKKRNPHTKRAFSGPSSSNICQLCNNPANQKILQCTSSTCNRLFHFKCMENFTVDRQLEIPKCPTCETPYPHLRELLNLFKTEEVPAERPMPICLDAPLRNLKCPNCKGRGYRTTIQQPGEQGKGYNCRNCGFTF